MKKPASTSKKKPDTAPRNPFIYDAWYVAGWSRDFDHALTPLTILGEPVVIFRTLDGVPAALEDACPHRKLPLSRGRLHDDRIECGYHGLTFDGTGTCVHAPTQEKAVPASVRVKSYAVAERWDILWIWMGERADANPDDILAIENFDNPAWGKTPGGTMDIACHYLYITDNLLDPSHVAWVHVGSFASPGAENTPVRIDPLEDGVVVSRWLQNHDIPPYYAPLVSFDGTCDRKQHYECRLPSIAINKSVFTPAGTGGDEDALAENAYINISYHFMTPVDEDNTRYFWFQHRNTDPHNREISRRMFEDAKTAFMEDRDVLVRIHQGMKHRRTRNINLGIDAGAMRFRRMVDRKIRAQGQFG